MLSLLCSQDSQEGAHPQETMGKQRSSAPQGCRPHQIPIHDLAFPQEAQEHHLSPGCLQLPDQLACVSLSGRAGLSVSPLQRAHQLQAGSLQQGVLTGVRSHPLSSQQVDRYPFCSHARQVQGLCSCLWSDLLESLHSPMTPLSPGPTHLPTFKSTYRAKATASTQVFGVLVWVEHADLELSDLASGQAPGF